MLRTCLGFVSLILAGRRHVGIKQTGSSTERPQSWMTAGWATDMKNVEEEMEGTCTDAVEMDLEIEQET